MAVPQNLAVAVNYDCTSCLTYSLAVQLFVTLDGPLSDAAMASIDELWQQIVAYGASIGQVPLDEIQDQLTEYEQQILDIIEADQGPLDGTETPSPTDDPTDDHRVGDADREQHPDARPRRTSETPTPTPTETHDHDRAPTEPADRVAELDGDAVRDAHRDDVALGVRQPVAHRDGEPDVVDQQQRIVQPRMSPLGDPVPSQG